MGAERASGDENGAGEECPGGGQSSEDACGSTQYGTARRGVDSCCSSGEAERSNFTMRAVRYPVSRSPRLMAKRLQMPVAIQAEAGPRNPREASGS